MAFDPTKPADHSPIIAAELRNQFNALQEQITALQQQMAPLVLTANNATMSMDWTCDGPTCDDFHIFEHPPSQAAGVFNDRTQVTGDLRTWATGFDDPVTPPSNTVNFATG